MRAIFANSLDVMLDGFEESEHPRAGEGPEGGQFVAKGGSAPAAKHRVHNKYGEVGEKFTATMGAKHLKPGDVLAENEQGRALKVLSLGPKTSTGGQWYNFEVVNAEAEQTGGKGSKSAHLVAAPADREQWPEHIKKLVVPPAWTGVKIAQNPDADLLVIGKDKAGRDQYVYSEKFSKSQAALKFARMEGLRKDRPLIEGQLAELRKSTEPGKRDHADCAILVMKMGVRPGSDTDTKAKVKAYGATTLEGKHVVDEGGAVFLRFVAKKGISLNLPVEDKALAATLTKRAKKAGPDGRIFGDVRDGSLLDFVHGLDHGGYKTKDFRTALANDLAAQAIKGVARPVDAKTYKKAVREVALKVSSRLGNTPTVALQSYIHPALFAPWQGAMAVVQKKGEAPKASSGKPVEKLSSKSPTPAAAGLNAAQKAWATRRAAREAQNAAA
jgi:DNA topoisomerase-1